MTLSSFKKRREKNKLPGPNRLVGPWAEHMDIFGKRRGRVTEHFNPLSRNHTMITVDIKSLLGRMNSFCTRCMETAAGHCVSRAQYEVTVEHLLSKLIEEPQADVAFILRQFEIDPGKLAKAIDQVIDEFKTGNSGKPVFSPMLIEWFQEAWLIGSVDFRDTAVRSGSLLMALLKNPLRFASGRGYIDIISTISADKLF